MSEELSTSNAGPKWPAVSWSSVLAFVAIPAVIGLVYAVAVVAGFYGANIYADYVVFVALVIAVIVAAVGFSDSVTGWFERNWQPLPIYIALVSLLLVPVIESIRYAYTNNAGMFGVAPIVDAMNYISGAWQMLTGAGLDGFNQRRPLNAHFTSVRLLLSGFNLHALLVWNAVLVGGALLYAALEVKKHVGPIGAAMFALIIFALSQSFLSSTLSEVLGLSLGLIGLTSLLAASRTRSVVSLLLGIAVLSVALAARAGCQFVLPGIWLWGILYFGDSRREKLFIAIAGTAAVLLGTVSSVLLVRLFADGNVLALNENFAQVIYGIARGGGGWALWHTEHPELWSLSPGKRAAALFRLSFHEIVSNPGRFLAYCASETFTAVSFLAAGPRLRQSAWDGTTIPVISAAVALIQGLGLLRIAAHPLQRTNALLGICVVGMLLSFPLIWQDGGLRVLAPMFSVLAVLGALGTLTLSKLSKERSLSKALAISEDQPSAATVDWKTAAAVPSFTLFAVLLLPLIFIGRFKETSVLNAAPSAECGATDRLLEIARSDVIWNMRVHAGGGVPVFASINDISFGQLQNNMTYAKLRSFLQRYPAPYTAVGMLLTADSSTRLQYVFWPGNLADITSRDRWKVCVQLVSPEKLGYRWPLQYLEVTKAIER